MLQTFHLFVNCCFPTGEWCTLTAKYNAVLSLNIDRGVARAIAKRRAGLLGWTASPNGGINSLVLAPGCCPVRFDLEHSLFSGLESKAADRSVRSTQTNPRGAPPIHGLLDYGEHKRQSNCAGGKLQIPHFVRDDNLWVGGRGIPPLAQNARSGPPGCHKSKSKAAGEGARATQALAAFFASSNLVISTRKGGAAAALFDGARR